MRTNAQYKSFAFPDYMVAGDAMRISTDHCWG